MWVRESNQDIVSGERCCCGWMLWAAQWGKKKKSIDLHCIQVKVEISECFRQIKKKNFVRVYTTKGGWDDCTLMNWPFNFKPASLEVTPQIVSVIKSPFPNPSVLAKTFFWGGSSFRFKSSVNPTSMFGCRWALVCSHLDGRSAF